MDPLTAGLAGAAVGPLVAVALMLAVAFLAPSKPAALPRRELRAVVADVLDNEAWSQDGDSHTWSAHNRHSYSASCAVCAGDTDRIADAVTDAIAHRLTIAEQDPVGG